MVTTAVAGAAAADIMTTHSIITSRSSSSTARDAAHQAGLDARGTLLLLLLAVRCAGAAAQARSQPCLHS
jgi:hypothetical protein